MNNKVITDKVIKAVKELKSSYTNLGQEKTVAFNIDYRDTNGFYFSYGVTICNILDCVFIIGGVWGTDVNTYINLEDSLNDEDIAETLLNHLYEIGGDMEVTGVTNAGNNLQMNKEMNSMKSVKATVFTMDEFNNLLSRATGDNLQITNECGKWFFVESEEYKHDESKIVKLVAKFLNIEATQIAVDISKGIVILY